MASLLLDTGGLTGTLLTGIGEQWSVWIAAVNHPLALAGFLLVIYGLLAALRHQLSDCAGKPSQATGPGCSGEASWDG